MSKFKYSVLAALTGLCSHSALADNLPATYLINAQLHQKADVGCTSRSDCSYDGAVSDEADIGYYQFNQSTGQVTHMRLDYSVDKNYYNTVLSSKHVNVAIPDLYGNGIDHSQVCLESDMGQIHRPTSTTKVSSGTYTYQNGVLEINIDNTQLQWQLVGGANGRWEPVAPKTLTTSGSSYYYSKIRGFGYFTNSLGSSPLDLKDPNQFAPGVQGNSARGYVGSSYHNVVSGVQPSDGWDWPEYFGEFKLAGYYMSNQGVDSTSPSQPNVYSNIWYPNNSDPVFVQKTLQTNYYTALPTLIYENTGHIYHGFSKVPYAYESQAAFDSRRCFTQSDAAHTQGHTLVHMGVWQALDDYGNVQGPGISDMVSLEISKQSPYPYLTISWGRRID